MNEIEHFVPGSPGEDEGVLSHLRWPIPPGVTRSYLEAYTAPGETVLVPYCQGAAVVREILDAERRALALNFDPVLVLLVGTALGSLPARELNAAVARLGHTLKQGAPLQRYLEELYATTCPACLRPAIADYFVWDREKNTPVAKFLHCPACDWDGRTAIELEDESRLAEVPVREMHYHYILDRVAPQPAGHGIRARLEQLLGLYTPRNLYALAELTMRIDGLFPDGPLRQALYVMLLDCLDRCSSLTQLPTSVARRRGLARPDRFLEKNVWRAFEEAVDRVQAAAGAPVSGLAGTLEAFVTSGEQQAGADGKGTEVGFIGEELVRTLPQSLPPRSVSLILTSPPALDSAAWALSYFWGAWLFGAEAVTALRPLLRQRTPDTAWYARVMASSLRNLASLLHDRGRLALILTGQRPAMVEALVLAASRARLGVTSLVQCGADYRLELTPTYPQPALDTRDPATSAAPGPLEGQIQEAAKEAAVRTIRNRGEPITWRTLHAAIHRRLAEAGLWARALGAESEGVSALDLVAEQVQAGLDDPAFVRLPDSKGGEGLWWLADPAGAAPPLGDRVEQAAYEALQGALALTEDGFAMAVYNQFPGTLTPEASLVATCLREYGREVTTGYWQLRSEDLPEARRAERTAIVEDLLALGQRLGYRTAPWPPFDAAWFEGEPELAPQVGKDTKRAKGGDAEEAKGGDARVRAVFVVRWQAAVSEALALNDRLEGATPYLVIPGGRSALVSYKLARNSLWQQAMEEAGWRFIKYRHVRQLAAQPEIDEFALQTIIGLDPIVEQESAQLSLF